MDERSTWTLVPNKLVLGQRCRNVTLLFAKYYFEQQIIPVNLRRLLCTPEAQAETTGTEKITEKIKLSVIKAPNIDKKA